MALRKVKSYVCVHCGYEIATIYQTDDGQWLDSHRGIQLRVSDFASNLGMLECPRYCKETPVNWRELQPKWQPARGVVVKPIE
jgi:hypothetical protein